VPSPGKKAFLVRLDPALWKELEQCAAADLRSINGEVEYLLREALRRRKAPGLKVAEPKRRTGSTG
jgi:hypothetical protein